MAETDRRMAKETAEPKDQSMEEILQSIKRIIAEEGHEGGERANGASSHMDASVKGSDVLELKDLSEATAPEGAVLELTEELDEAVVPTTQVTTPAAELKATLTDDSNRDVLADIDSLLSDETLKTSAAALRALNNAGSSRRETPRTSVEFRSGVTVEDLVVEALKPMLKDWLDANLPDLVRQLVEKEIRKLTS